MSAAVLNDILELEDWTNYISRIVSFTGNADLIAGFDWEEAKTLTVGEYLHLLDAVEDALATYDWSPLEYQLPTIRTTLADAGLSKAQVNLVIGVIEGFIDGDLGPLYDGIDLIRDHFNGVHPDTPLVDAIDGSGGGGSDPIEGTSGKDVLLGTKNADEMDGKGGNDVMKGKGGGDDMKGGKGNDRMFGQGGKDDIDGGAGRDKINGGKGDDVLTGGAKKDTFLFRRGDGDDTITDFKVGVDLIKIAGVDELSDMSFTKNGKHVDIAYKNIEITVENVTKAELMDVDNFILG